MLTSIHLQHLTTKRLTHFVDQVSALQRHIAQRDIHPDAEVFRDYVRDYLATPDDQWGDERRRMLLIKLLREHAVYDDDAMARVAASLSADVARFLATDECALLRSADRAWFDAPMLAKLPGGKNLRLHADVLERHGAAWRVVNFDTREIASDAEPTVALVEDNVHRELIHATYLLALGDAGVDVDLARIVTYFTKSGVSVVEQPSTEWLRAWESMLPQVARIVQPTPTSAAPAPAHRGVA